MNAAVRQRAVGAHLVGDEELATILDEYADVQDAVALAEVFYNLHITVLPHTLVPWGNAKMSEKGACLDLASAALTHLLGSGWRRPDVQAHLTWGSAADVPDGVWFHSICADVGATCWKRDGDRFRSRHGDGTISAVMYSAAEVDSLCRTPDYLLFEEVRT